MYYDTSTKKVGSQVPIHNIIKTLSMSDPTSNQVDY
jgi:hypothetical protein